MLTIYIDSGGGVRTVPASLPQGSIEQPLEVITQGGVSAVSVLLMPPSFVPPDPVIVLSSELEQDGIRVYRGTLPAWACRSAGQLRYQVMRTDSRGVTTASYTGSVAIQRGAVGADLMPETVSELSDESVQALLAQLSAIAEQGASNADELAQSVTAARLYSVLTGLDGSGKTLADAVAPLVTETELTDAMNGVATSPAVLAAVEQLVKASLFNNLVESLKGTTMNYGAKTKLLAVTIAGTMATATLSGCISRAGRAKLADYLSHALFVADDAEADRIESGINDLETELTADTQSVISVSLSATNMNIVGDLAPIIPTAGKTLSYTLTPHDGFTLDASTVSVRIDGVTTTSGVTVTQTGATVTVTISATQDMTAIVISATAEAVENVFCTLNGASVGFVGGIANIGGVKITKATAGDTVTFSVSAADGYRLASCTINGTAQTSAAVNRYSGSTVAIIAQAVRVCSVTLDLDGCSNIGTTTAATVDAGATVNFHLVPDTPGSAVDDLCTSISGISGLTAEVDGENGYTISGTASGDISITATAESMMNASVSVSAVSATVSLYSGGTWQVIDASGAGITIGYAYGFNRRDTIRLKVEPAIGDGTDLSPIVTDTTPAGEWTETRNQAGGADYGIYLEWQMHGNGTVSVYRRQEINTASETGGALTIGGLYGTETDGALIIDIS